MIEILKEGQLPQKKVYIGTCTNCGTQARFLQEDATYKSGRYNESSYVIQCPLKGCGKDIWVDSGSYEKPSTYTEEFQRLLGNTPR